VRHSRGIEMFISLKNIIVILVAILGVYSLVIFGLPDVFLLIIVGGFFSMEDCIIIIDDGFLQIGEETFFKGRAIERVSC